MTTNENLIDPKTFDIKRRAIKDFKEAWELCKRIESDNSERNTRNAEVTKEVNARQPWSQTELDANGEDWRRNYSTGFLSSLVNRAKAPYIESIDSARYFTYSKLDNDDPASTQKSESFRKNITKTVKKWKNFRSFINLTINENTLFGYATPAWTDEWEWRPSFFRQDEAFIPNNTEEDSETCPLVVLKRDLLLHELFPRIDSDDSREISTQAGWEIDNLVKAINNAQPAQTSRTESDQRKEEDKIRDGSVAESYTDGIKVVEIYELLIKEPSSQMISHFIVNRKNGEGLFQKIDQFESMEQVSCFFSIDPFGNGKLHGSKGVGRALYNISVGVEQARNLISDSLFLSGLLVLKSTGKNKTKTALTINHPVAIVSEGYETEGKQFNVNTDAYFQLDQHLTSVAETRIGTFTPGTLLNAQSGSKPTATAITYVASIETQIRDTLRARFWGQFMMLMSEIQRRICNEDNIQEAMRIYREENQNKLQKVTLKFVEFVKKIGSKMAGFIIVDKSELLNPEAVECCLRLLKEGLSAEEIFQLANSGAMEDEYDNSAERAQGIDLVTARYKGDPNINQKELAKRDISSKVGNTMADVLIIDEEDNTIEVEAVRQQLIELNSLMDGESIPVSPRDNDLIHMQTIEEKAKQMVSTLSSATEETIPIIENISKHYEEHLQSALSKGLDSVSLQPQADFIKGIREALNQAYESPAPTTLPSLPIDSSAIAPNGNPVAFTEQALSNEVPTDPSQAIAEKPLLKGQISL